MKKTISALMLSTALVFAAGNAAQDRFSGIWRASADLGAVLLAQQVDARAIVDTAARWRAQTALAVLADFTSLV